MTVEEQDNFTAAEGIKRIRHELRELDAIASAPIPLEEIAAVSNKARTWESVAKARLSVRQSRKGKNDNGQGLLIG